MPQVFVRSSRRAKSHLRNIRRATISIAKLQKKMDTRLMTNGRRWTLENRVEILRGSLSESRRGALKKRFKAEKIGLRGFRA